MTNKISDPLASLTVVPGILGIIGGYTPTLEFAEINDRCAQLFKAKILQERALFKPLIGSLSADVNCKELVEKIARIAKECQISDLGAVETLDVFALAQEILDQDLCK